MHELCETITGQSVNLEPIICGEVGIRIGDVVRCKKHWAKVRNRKSQALHNHGKASYKNYLNRPTE